MPITAKVLSITGDRVSLGFGDGQKVELPVSVFEGTPKEGLDVTLLALVLGSEDAGRTAVARNLLNELLRT
ncbi:MAG: hypothetical protein WA001_02205 [Patescibacteria group bacterium]